MSPGSGFPHPELGTSSLLELAAKLRRGELSARRLTEMYLERIASIDRQGPELRAVIELNPDALDIAGGLDAEPARGLLHGMPILVKDNLDTGDRMLTTAGSLALTAAPAPRDADVIARLRAAGCVILGKTNLSEWANFRSTRSASGWSGRGRQTRNPHVLDRTPSGSSSGSAAAVAAGLAAAAIGTETDGSIISPSNANGVVGFKPTVGLISQRGIIPISHSQDTAGTHTRTVADAAALLAAMVEAPLVPSSQPLTGARLGVLRAHYTGYSEHTDSVYERALATLTEVGAVLIEVEMPTALELRKSELERVVLQYEFKAGLEAYLAARTAVGVHTLADLIAFNEAHSAEEMPYFRQEILVEAAARGPLTEAAYLEARASCLEMARERGIDRIMADHALDALIAPSGQPAWVVDRINGDRGLGGASQMAAVAGYPHVTVPAGLAFDALPLGLSLFGAPGSDLKLLALAAGFEAATGAIREPLYLATLQLS